MILIEGNKFYRLPMPSSSPMFIHRPSTEVDSDWPWRWGEIRMPCLLLLTDDEGPKVRKSQPKILPVWAKYSRGPCCYWENDSDFARRENIGVWRDPRRSSGKRSSYGTAAAGVPTWMLDRGNLYRSNFVTGDKYWLYACPR
ncbi:hypothetical protein FOZ63_007018 [Perkinsus olseni]|uniref:Uncharacterized protein n=1 Tax=Perkinsus olseni TaxID=32597 RepID=A0A7J6PZS7_PEROL|nr:hypothetical protein FOZ63_007018 [Perkinsus olseni]